MPIYWIGWYDWLHLFQLEEVLVLVKKECELKKGQGDQQVESVRYLHELNAVRCSFVSF